MTYQEALSVIHRTDWKGSKLGLTRIRALLRALGDPQKDLRVIHVAGTNGKGSVCAFLASVLQEAGYRAGLYTSPYLIEFRERIRVGDLCISEEDVCRGMEIIAPILDTMDDAPTEFEVMTALAFWYFQKENCDYLVCEVGLGGEFDATNVIENPLLSVITTIGLDHTEVLGDTIQKIAAAKAGIVKESRPVLFGEGTDNPEAYEVIRARANACGAKLYLADQTKLCILESDLSGTRFSYRGSEYQISLCGAYQPQNAATALDALAVLQNEGVDLLPEAIRRGLKNARWIGRFEVASFDPCVILDGAHNESGVKALCASLDSVFKKKRLLAVTAVMADKDYRAMLSRIAPYLEEVFAVAPADTPRALDSQKLAAVCGEFGIPARAYETVEAGVSAALERAADLQKPLIVFGSLYLYREARKALTKSLPETR